MALRGFIRSMNRSGAWWRRIAIGGVVGTQNYPPLYVEPTTQPTTAGSAGDMYVTTDGELSVYSGTAYVPVARKAIAISLPTHAHAVDSFFFIADRSYVVESVAYVHAVAATDAGSVNVQIKKCTGTQAPDAGSNLLPNNTNAGFNCKSTINTVQTGTLTGTLATKTLASGNRLSLDFTGTTTDLAGVALTIILRPL